MSKICLAANSGGHLNQLLQLQRMLKGHKYLYVTDKNDFSKELARHEKVHFVEKFVLKQCLKNMSFSGPLRNFWQSYRVIKREQPDVIITTGAGTAFGSCLVGRLLGKKVIFIESIARCRNASTFGKIISLISNVVFVQWRRMLNEYPRAAYAGIIFDFSNVTVDDQKTNRIFVTTGTYELQFDRVLVALDSLKRKGALDADIVAQIGHSTYRAQHYKTFRFAPQNEIHDWVNNSELVICHGGSGSIMDALVRGKRVIAIPRLPVFGEYFDDHQLEIVGELERLGLILAVYDMAHLGRVIAEAESFQPKLQHIGGRFEALLSRHIPTA
jgi:UDP-N-acetylglucosamine--N-acetylmuramyl-(pentapeptide) pyrophosphoryl-undecaprenol N-acetylglucosamine transferase